jgi:hypothetical protein
VTTGMHAIVFSPQAEKLRALFDDVHAALAELAGPVICQPRHPSPPRP